MQRFRIPSLIAIIIATGILAYVFRPEKPATGQIPDILGQINTRGSATGWPIAVEPTPVPGLSPDRIFAADHTWVGELPEERTVTMVATGDVLTARSVNYKMVTEKGFAWPFEKTRDVLVSADIAVINLETPLLSGCEPTNEGMIFCGDPRAVEGFVSAGIDVATLANNHMANHYRAGAEETARVLKAGGILPVNEAPEIRVVKGVRFAYLAYNDIGTPEDGVSWADEVGIRDDIRTVRKEADVVVIAVHWGIEYVTQPSEHQRQLARFMIDNGADVVLGNHPHWIQPVELYRDKFISYSHGNFVFDQEWSPETKTGVVGRYTFFDGKLIDVEYLPVRIVDYGQPYFLPEEEARSVVRRMHEASTVLAGTPIDIPQ